MLRSFVALFLASGLIASGALAQEALVVYADTLYTMAGPPIVNGAVVIRDGKIQEVGTASGVRVPAGAREVRGAVVTPGLVDVRSTVGLSHLINQENDELDRGGPLQPSLRAMDAYDARDELVGFLLSLGITTVHTGHAPGALAAGQTTIVKTAYETIDAALVDSTTMMAMTVGARVGNTFDSPGTRARTIAEIRRAMYSGLAHGEKMDAATAEKPLARDLDKEALAAVARGQMPALITAHRANDILSVLRLAREFPQMRVILSGAAEASLVADQIRASGVSVVLHPTMYRSGGETESLSFSTAGRLHTAGIPFAIQSGFEAYVPKTRVVLFEAAVAAAYGLDRVAALESITIDAAEILGIADRVGSLARGKDADLAVFDGDPLETVTHVCAVVVDGNVVRDECF